MNWVIVSTIYFSPTKEGRDPHPLSLLPRLDNVNNLQICLYAPLNILGSVFTQIPLLVYCLPVSQPVPNLLNSDISLGYFYLSS